MTINELSLALWAFIPIPALAGSPRQSCSGTAFGILRFGEGKGPWLRAAPRVFGTHNIPTVTGGLSRPGHFSVLRYLPAAFAESTATD